MNISPKIELKHVFVLIKRTSILLWLYGMARLYFYISNKHLFAEIDTIDVVKCCIYGMRYDLSIIVFTNIPFILLHILPLSWRDRVWYQRICKFLFYLVNGSSLVIMIADAEYYPFSMRHGTVELIDFMFDFIQLLPAYLADFWYLIPITFILIAITEFFYRRTFRFNKKNKIEDNLTQPSAKRHFLIQLLLFCLMGGLSFLAVRGGLQSYPLSPVEAGRYGPASWTPLIVNTPFTIYHSAFHPKLKPLKYFDEQELPKYFSYLHQPSTDTSNTSNSRPKQNIFIIILESFSAEYTDLYDPVTSVTPFLDSLSKQSLVFTQMNANAMRSIDGIPAILGGIPAQMDESFLSSIYQSNNYKGIAGYLRDMGYSTSCYHGGHNGTFNLNNFCLASGFQKYYGLNEYPSKKGDISHWGVYDEPFFKFTGEEVNKMSTPFFASLFSLSSHHPYQVPEEYASKWPQHPDKILNSVRYADYALKQFFYQVEKEAWFKNTLFIITADHCGPALNTLSEQGINRLHVPLIFYHPTDTFFRGVADAPVQHIDILPTVLDYVHYPKPYYAFGEGVFHVQDRYTFGRIMGHDYVTDGKYMLEMFDEKVIALYQMNPQREFTNNILGQNPEVQNRLLLRLQAFKQTFINSLIENRMVY